MIDYTDFNFGVIIPPLDYRDVEYLASVGEPEVLPSEYLQDTTSQEILSQHQIPSCVSHSIANCMKLWWFKKTGEVVNFSPRFLDILSWTSWLSLDAGRDPREVMKIAMTVGCCTEELLPNNTNLPLAEYRDKSIITDEMKQEAAKYKIPGYAFVPFDEYSIKHAIYHSGMVSILTRIGSEWWTSPSGVVSWSKYDIMPLRTPKSPVGGHQTSLKGWHGSDIFRVLNEWGITWADQGENELYFTNWKPFTNMILVITDQTVDFHPLVQQLPKPEDFKHHFFQYLTYGSQGDEVKALQTALLITGDLKLDPSIPLGKFYNMTNTAAKKFQTNHGLVADGKVGPKTNAKLNELFDRQI